MDNDYTHKGNSIVIVNIGLFLIEDSKIGWKNKKSYRHGDLYNELLRAGKSLLEESGIRNLSLRNLAQTIGVSHNAPYRHFKEKAALMMAIADSGFEELFAAFLRIIKKYSDDPTKQFKELGERLTELLLLGIQA